MEALIEGIDLTKHYDGFTLDHVSLAVPAGYVVGLIGSNGAGKSTAIKALLGLIRLDAGQVRAFGQPPASPDWKQRVGVVFDTCSFVPTMTVGDVANLGRASYRQWDSGSFSQMIGHASIRPEKAVKDLSRGMGMKLSLAFAMAHNPDVLILDEPTAGLDPIARDEVLELLRAYMNVEGRGILISSHITDDLAKIADTIVCTDGGRTVFSMPKDDICDTAGIARCTGESFEMLAASGFFGSGGMRYLRRDLSWDVLVPDRFAFGRAFPDIVCDRATIDEYMLLMLKGATR